MKSPIVLFRESSETLDEFNIVQESSFNATNRILKIPSNSLVIGRYSVLPFYKELEEELKITGSELINSYEQHRYIADIENWYNDLKGYTPQTWFDWYDLPEGSYVVKGRTNSRKFQWNRQMFCKTKDNLRNIIDSLMDDSLIRDQGLCVRKYVPLKKFDEGINGLPITNEWRAFCYQNRFVSIGYYWSNFSECKPYEWKNLPNKAAYLIQDVMNIVSKNTNFYVVDIAETESGDWIVIELNDGQMSGLSDINPTELYSNLFKIISK
jgi:hypothetical protein